jgi:hypothetical protein
MRSNVGRAVAVAERCCILSERESSCKGKPLWEREVANSVGAQCLASAAYDRGRSLNHKTFLTGAVPSEQKYTAVIHHQEIHNINHWEGDKHT